MKNIMLLLGILAATLAFSEATLAQTPTDKQVHSIEKYMAPIRKKVTDFLEADKTGQYQTYKSDLANIAKETEISRREELVEKLERDHHEFIQGAYRKLVVNHEEMRREIVRILGHSNFSFGEFGDIQIEFTPPALALPVRFNGELHCPMEVSEESFNTQIASDGHAQAGSCSMSVQAIAEFAGGCRGKVSLGDKLELTGGNFNKVTAVVQTDYEYKGFAFAVAGYGQINAKFGLRFQGPGIDKVVLTKEVFALAPVIWFTRIKGSANNFVSQSSFSGNFPEGTIVTVQSYVEGFAISVPIATLTSIYAKTSNIDVIRISASN